MQTIKTEARETYVLAMRDALADRRRRTANEELNVGPGRLDAPITPLVEGEFQRLMAQYCVDVAETYTELENYDKALEALREASVHKPESGLALGRRGELLLKLKRYDKFVADFDAYREKYGIDHNEWLRNLWAKWLSIKATLKK